MRLVILRMLGLLMYDPMLTGNRCRSRIFPASRRTARLDCSAKSSKLRRLSALIKSPPMPALVSFTMDNLGDAADLYRGVIKSPRATGSNPPLEQGYPALLELFARYDIPLTCFIE